jgi:hypothetical protein
LNFKATPSQEEHKTIFSGLKINKIHLSGKSDATALFSPVRSTLCETYIDIPESQFSKTWRHKTILQGKGYSGLSYSKIDKIPVSHLAKTEKCQKDNMIRKSHISNL